MLRVLFFLLTFVLILPALAEDPVVAPSPSPSPAAPPPVPPKYFSQLWVDKTAVVTPEAVAATVAGLKAQQANPEHVVVYIHGFDVQRDESTAAFDALTLRLQQQFQPTNARVAYAGIQWQSAADSSVFQLANVYWEKISVARSVGRGPARELLLGIAKEFPKAHVTIMAHSMGCEVMAAAVVPEIEYAAQTPFVPTFAPESDVRVLMTVMCGSDLDDNIWQKSHVAMRSHNERTQLTWTTVAPFMGQGDEVLSVRAQIRGVAAGAAFPLMTLDQLNEVVSKRKMVFDGEDIPHDHAFEKYYDSDRLARIVPTMLYVSNPKGWPEPLELSELDQILEAPGVATALTPFLDNGRYGTLFYTLWRLEQVNCGDARHMTDGTLASVAHLLKNTPQMVWRAAAKSPCVTIKNGEFPTPTMMTRAGAPPRARKD